MRTLTCPPEAETIGQVLSAFSENIQGNDVEPIMAKHQMVGLDPMGWYPVQRLLNALNELAENPNTTPNLVAIGMKIGEMVPMPPGMENPKLEEVLAIWNDLYQGLHRNAELGHISIVKVSDKHYKTIHTNPYPDDMSYGILYAYGRRFLPKGTPFKVFYDPDFPARDYGGTGEGTIIHIQWD